VTGLDIVNTADKLHQCLVRCCHGNRRIIYQPAGRVSPHGPISGILPRSPARRGNPVWCRRVSPAT